MLELSLAAEDGTPVGTFDAWDPRWWFEEAPGGGEHVVIRNGPGTLTVPFDSDTGSLVVVDQRAGIELATVDLRPAVHEFCLGHPSDPECIEADLAITQTDATGPASGTVGNQVSVIVRAVVTNFSPGGPIDIDLPQTTTTTAGVKVFPDSKRFDVTLQAGERIEIQTEYGVTCIEAGAQKVTFTTSAVPEKAKVADLHPANDAKTATFSIDCRER